MLVFSVCVCMGGGGGGGLVVACLQASMNRNTPELGSRVCISHANVGPVTTARPSVLPSVCLSSRPFVRSPDRPSVRSSDRPYGCHIARPPVRPLVRPPVRPPARPHARPFDNPSARPFGHPLVCPPHTCEQNGRGAATEQSGCIGNANFVDTDPFSGVFRRLQTYRST